MHRRRGVFAVNEATSGDAPKLGAAELKQTHEHLILVLTPLIDDAAFDLVITAERVTHESKEALRRLIDEGARGLHALLAVHSEGNLIAGLLNQAAASPDTNLLQPLRERFDAAEHRLMRMLTDLPPAIAAHELRSQVTTLVNTAKGDDGVFALRRAELQEVGRAQSELDESRALAVQLGDQVAELVSATEEAGRTAARRSTGAVANGKFIMVLLSAASVAGVAVVMLCYVRPQIIRPLEHITNAMTDLAGGDTSVDIPGRDRNDELGRMARALGVFRDTAIEVQRSNLKEIRETRRRLSEAIESIDEAFSLYDSEDRLVVCNSKYRSLLYPGIADSITPGMTFAEIVQQAVQRGYIEDAQADPEGWLAGRLDRHRNPGESHIQERSNGRWILVSERKTDDGGTVAVYSDISELKQREKELTEKSNALEQVSNQLAKYLSPQVYESIFTGRQEVRVASRRRKLTVFFSDIANFTETADRLESEELTQLLNHYLTEMSRIALDYGATIDKYVGDGIVIFFGDPESKGVKEDALACVKMAIAMRNRMRDLEVFWRDSGIEQPLKCRIGISTGFCTVGNIGSEDRMDYTIIGGGVNLASRLEGAATPGDILISYETHALVKDDIKCEHYDQLPIKGIAYPVATYRVIDGYDNLDESAGWIREVQPNLKLDVNIGAMSPDERTQAVAALRTALGQIAQFK